MPQVKIKQIFASKIGYLCILALFAISANAQDITGVWTASGSGASTTWAASAGLVNVTASATNYGSGTGFTLNDFVTNDNMGCATTSYSDPAVFGNPSLSVRHTFPNSGEITFVFNTKVINPVLNFDRFGGGGGADDTTTSSLVRIVTPGITFSELAQNDVHFVTTATTVTRQSGTTFTSSPAECGPPNAGTAAGSVRLVGVFDSITLSIEKNQDSRADVNDRFELAWSEIEAFDSDNDGVLDDADLDDDNDGILDAQEENCGPGVSGFDGIGV